MRINLEKQVNNNGELILAAYEFVKQLGKKNINDVEKIIIRLTNALETTTTSVIEKTKHHEDMMAENTYLIHVSSNMLTIAWELKKIERPTIWRSNRIDSIELLYSKIEKLSHLTSANHNLQSQQSNKYVMKKHKKQIRTNRVKAEKIIKKNCPNTDIFLQELWNRARNEGINYTADSIAKAYNNGYIDKSLTEIYHIVRMILGAKRELSNATSPSVDGMSGKYSAISLNKWEEEIRTIQRLLYCKKT